MKIAYIITFLVFISAWLAIIPSSKEYWQNVGPRWDKVLNPDKYLGGKNDLQ
jgi:hypothetical protein